MSSSFLPAKETDILREISLYLKFKRHFFWRQNTTGTFDPVRKIFLKPHNITPGVSDLILLKDGVLHAIEVKSAKGKQSPEQIIFQNKITQNGGIYILARCVQDVINSGL